MVTLTLGGNREKAEAARQHNTERDKVSDEQRPTRVPVDGRRDIMTVSGKDDGYVYRWVNDIEDNIDRFKRGWYEFVTHSVRVGAEEINQNGDGSPIKKYVGQQTYAYLMRIRKEYYEEDQRNFNERIDESEADLFRELNDGSDGKYGSVSMRRR